MELNMKRVAGPESGDHSMEDQENRGFDKKLF